MASSDIGQGLSDFSFAVSDLFGAKGATASASSYDEAAAIARQNAAIARQATDIKLQQQTREIYKTLGTQKAQVGGAGFAASGSALDLLADSAMQGAFTKAITTEQGAVSENSYAEQAGLYSGMAQAARSSATGQTIGGLLAGAGGLINLFSGASKLFGGAGGDISGGDAIPGAAMTGIGEMASSFEGADIVATVAEVFAFA